MKHEVVIAGGGPTGMMLAGELALAGVDVAIVERRASQELAGSRAGGLHSRTIEVLDQRGIADRFLAEGQKAQVAEFAGVRLDISDFPTRHNYGLGLWQNHIERILAGWVDELAVPIYRGVEVTGFAQDDTGVDVELSDGRVAAGAISRRVRRRTQPGPQGRRHRVPGIGSDHQQPDRRGRDGRDAAGMGHPPRRPRHPFPRPGGVRDPRRRDSLRGSRTGRRPRDRTARRTRPPNPPCAISARRSSPYTGPITGSTAPTSISRFTDAARQAASYRNGRVLLAGDAAHVHPPDGGQGLQTGVQDAVNLGWKLAQVVKGTSPESLLDTYHAERHPVGARVLRNTMASVVLRREDERTKALRDTIAELLGMDEPRRRFAAMMSGLDIHYDLGEGHPLLGRRMPDLDLVTANGPLRVFTLLHAARPVLLNLGEPGGFDITPWADRVQLIDAKYVGPWELPASWAGHCSHRRVDSARRICGLGGRPEPSRGSLTR